MSTPLPNAGVRHPARAGQFYPAQPTRMREMADAFLAMAGRDVELEKCRAIMLPHAGWPYCGATLGKTLGQVRVPDTAIILGPRHTPYGPAWSVAPHERWDIPGGSVPIARDLVEKLVTLVPRLHAEPEAHRIEHGSEVLLPFLHRVNENISVVPIVLGEMSFEDTQGFAAALARVVREAGREVLLVISSDMNHFANEDDTAWLDNLALEAMETGDPRGLFLTCGEYEISMCGMRPAVTVMQTLIQLGGPIRPRLIDHTTSGATTGDHASVVGYAGVVIP